jgi:hypothetical protein
VKVAAVVIAVLTIATTVGTALTVGLYSVAWGRSNHIPWVSALVAAGHLLLCGTYALMGESEIEDGVKSGFIVVCGGLLLSGLPLLGLFAISAAIWALVVNQSLQRALAK